MLNSEELKTFQDIERELQIAFRKVMAQREEILEAFVAKWGFSPEETVQIIHRTSAGEKFWVEKRVPEITPELLDHAADVIKEYRAHVNLGKNDETDTILRVAALSLRNRRIDASFSNSET